MPPPELCNLLLEHGCGGVPQRMRPFTAWHMGWQLSVPRISNPPVARFVPTAKHSTILWNLASRWGEWGGKPPTYEATSFSFMSTRKSFSLISTRLGAHIQQVPAVLQQARDRGGRPISCSHDWRHIGGREKQTVGGNVCSGTAVEATFTQMKRGHASIQQHTGMQCVQTPKAEGEHDRRSKPPTHTPLLALISCKQSQHLAQMIISRQTAANVLARFVACSCSCPVPSMHSALISATQQPPNCLAATAAVAAPG
jgi:hypothetical protein